MKSNFNYILFLTLFLFSCNFTSTTHKKILQAQKFLLDQEYVKASVIYMNILDKNPPLDVAIKINYQLGDIFSVYLTKTEESVKYYNKVLEISDDPFWLVKAEERLGEINFSYLKKYRESAKNYQKLSNFKPKLQNQDFYHYRYAISLMKAKKYKESEKEFIKINELTNHQYYRKSFFNLGLISFQFQKWSEAINYWEKYISLKPNRESQIQTKFLIANTYESLEKLKKAYNIYYSILGEYPNSEVIQNKLKSIYKRRISRKR